MKGLRQLSHCSMDWCMGGCLDCCICCFMGCYMECFMDCFMDCVIGCYNQHSMISQMCVCWFKEVLSSLHFCVV